MAWAAFFIQIFPLTFIAGIGVAFGLGFMAERIPVSLQLPIAIMGLLIFIALITFREVGGWNLGLLIGFGVVAGAFLGSIFPTDRSLDWSMALLAALGFLFLASAAGNWLGERLRNLGVALWIASWVYLLGWVLLAVVDLPSVSQIIWALAGLIIFSGLASTWFANLMITEAPSSNVSLAIDLFILGMNLLVAGRVLIGAVV